jgi:hypothetical protein
MSLLILLLCAPAWERIPIDVHISQRCDHSLLLLVIIGLWAFLLPARYSIGLFEAMSIFYLSFVIFMPFALIQIPIYRFRCRCVVSQKPQDYRSIPPPPELLPRRSRETRRMSPILKSILFWAVLIGVITMQKRPYAKIGARERCKEAALAADPAGFAWLVCKCRVC